MDDVNNVPCPLYVRAGNDAKRLTPRTGTDSVRANRLTSVSQSWFRQTLSQTAPLPPLPDSITSLDQFRVQRRDGAGGVFINIAWWHKLSAVALG
jgi:hypothetical protein